MANQRRDSNRWIGIAIKGIARGEEGGQAKEVSEMAFFPYLQRLLRQGMQQVSLLFCS